MKRLALSYLAIIILASLAITVDPMGWLKKPSPRVEAEAAAERPSPVRSAPDTAAAVSSPAVTPAEAIASDLETTTAQVLAGLANPAAAPPAAPAGGDAVLSAMSASALAGLRSFRAPAVAAAPPVTLQRLVTQALREGQSDAYIDALVNEAAGRGEIAAPPGLVTAEGRVDTAVLLASIVARAQGAELEEGDASDPDADALLAALPRAATQDVLHLVQPGESLGGLALRYYGDAGKYPVIYDANRRILSGPDRIAVGQRLVVPALSRL
ncbi:MAG: LysM peptidoglycan-binding domain-containing protein [Gemmobacter sp.]